MHLNKIELQPEKYPNLQFYPFNLEIFQQTKFLQMNSPITYFVGENGTGKSTLLRAISQKCNIHIWENPKIRRIDKNPYEKNLFKAIDVVWQNGSVPGSFFASEIFQEFSEIVEEWAVADPGMIKYFGGKSLLTQSHGQSLISFFASRYKIKGLYLLDEPETALSPKSQLELLKIMMKTGESGCSQFIVATHSPILLACPIAKIYSFDFTTIQSIQYRETEYYKFYKDFMDNHETYFHKFFDEK